MHDVVTTVLSPSRSMTGISFRVLFFSWTIVIRVFLNSICFVQSRPFLFATSSLLLATSSSSPRTTRRAFTKPSSSWSSSTITSSNPSSIRLPPLPSFSRSVVHCASVVRDDEKNTTRWPATTTSSDSTCSTTTTSPDACQQLQELQHHPAGEDGDCIQLTLLLPAYNEEFRIRPTLFNYTNYLLSSFGGSRGGRCGQNSTSGSNSSGATTFFSMEILVVNDGSTDNMVKVVEECKNWLLEQLQQQQQQQQQTGTLVLTSIDCLTLVENQGKGSAISKGLEYIDKNRQSKRRVATTTTTTTATEVTAATMSKLGQDNDTLHSWMLPSAVSPRCRQWVLVVDADGSGDITYLDAILLKFLEFLQNPMFKHKEEKPTQEQQQQQQQEWGMLIGNRIDGSASPSRSITRWGFQTIVRWICGDLGVKDTQCGMKVMTLDAGLATYSHLHLKRWTHDVEVFYRARELGIPVMEMDVGWEDKDGSKLTTSWVQTIRVSGVMLLEIVMMRVQYMLGRWKVGNVNMEECVK